MIGLHRGYIQPTWIYFHLDLEFAHLSFRVRSLIDNYILLN